jgi:carbonic anhydrase
LTVEIIDESGIGDVFEIRIAGNVVNEGVLGSMEYATKAVGSKLLVVLGHTCASCNTHHVRYSRFRSGLMSARLLAD